MSAVLKADFTCYLLHTKTKSHLVFPGRVNIIPFMNNQWGKCRYSTPSANSGWSSGIPGANRMIKFLGMFPEKPNNWHRFMRMSNSLTPTSHPLSKSSPSTQQRKLLSAACIPHLIILAIIHVLSKGESLNLKIPANWEVYILSKTATSITWPWINGRQWTIELGCNCTFFCVEAIIKDISLSYN